MFSYYLMLRCYGPKISNTNSEGDTMQEAALKMECEVPSWTDAENYNPVVTEVCAATRDYWDERSQTFGLDGDIDKWGDLIQQKLLQRKVFSPSILDAGCGTGAMLLTLASRGYQVCGVDFSQGMLNRAKQNAKRRGLDVPFVQGYVDQLPFASETFDVVVSRNVLSNLAVAKEALANWHDVLKPGGYLIYFDSPWWNYLHDDNLDAKKELAYGTGSSPIFNVLEELAKDMDISSAQRPAWDVAVLSSLGFEVEAVEDVSARVWNEEEQRRYQFAPQFMVVAKKRAWKGHVR